MVNLPSLDMKFRTPSSSSSSSTSSSESDGNSNKPSFTRRLSNMGTHMIIKVPVRMRQVAQRPGISSWDRETKYFTSITAMHGVKRVYESRGFYKLFWGIMVIACATVLGQQLWGILASFNDEPVNTQVLFPKLVICSFNPVKKSYIKKLNETGDLSLEVLRYLMLFNNDVLTTFGNGNETTLIETDKKWRQYCQEHPDFSFHNFFYDAGFRCQDIMKSCSFAGRPFDCCSYSTPRLTSMGRCFEMSLSSADVEWMKKQTEGGDRGGLQIVLDAHLHEQVKDIQDNSEAVLSTQFEHGFRFYIVEPATSTYSSSQGINVSPGDFVYTALQARKYELLKLGDWGDCIDKWPEGYTGANTKLKYQSLDCMTKCKARTFNTLCGCSPFIYDIDNEFKSCTPLETFRCMQNKIIINRNETSEEFSWPPCDECKSECHRWEFLAYNSYSRGFTDAAMTWLQSKNANWTPEVIRSSFLTINVHFRDMTFSVFRQEKGTSLAQTLSNMGGTMGLFLGMSVLTMIEIIIYLWKILWIAVSRSRRSYIVEKKRKEEIEHQAVTETIQDMRGIGTKTLKEAMEQMQSAAGTIKRLRSKFSISGKPNEKSSTVVTPTSKDAPPQSFNAADFPDYGAAYDNQSYHDDDVFNKEAQNDVIEVEIDLKELKREIRKQSSAELGFPRNRSHSHKSSITRVSPKNRIKSGAALSSLPTSEHFYIDGPIPPASEPATPTVPEFPYRPTVPHLIVPSSQSHDHLPTMAEDPDGEEAAARSRKTTPDRK